MLTTNNASTGGEGGLTNTGDIITNTDHFNANTGSLIANGGNLNGNTSGLTDNGGNSHGNTDAVTGVNGTLNGNTADLTLRSASQGSRTVIQFNHITVILDRSTVRSVRQGNTRAENYISFSFNRGGVVYLHVPAGELVDNYLMEFLVFDVSYAIRSANVE